MTIPDSYWPLLAKIESSSNPNAKAGTSSASGLYQMTQASWQAEGGAWGSDPTKAFGGLKPSAAEQTQRVKTFTAKNAGYLSRIGITINAATLYAAHFLGAGTAAKVLVAGPKARADLLAGTAATNANPTVLRDKTVAQFKAWLAVKTGATA